MVLSHGPEPQFSQPVRQIVMMLIVLGLTAAVSVLIFPAIGQIFLASPYLKIFIVFVFRDRRRRLLLAGVHADRRGELDRGLRARPPGARVHQGAAAAGAAGGDARGPPGASVADLDLDPGSILETVATRIEEQRDLTRYIISLLIFLGLLGTFYGLATVVPAVVDTIRVARPAGGAGRDGGLRQPDDRARRPARRHGHRLRLVAARPLGVSLVVGLLELFASHAQNRFYRELEEWLSGITRIGIHGVEPEEALTAANVLAVIGQTAEQIDSLRETVEANVARAAETDARLGALARAAWRAPKPEPAPAVDSAILMRIASAQERLVHLLEAREGEGGGIDAETRARLRSIDTQVLRILDDLSAGRQDLVTEIRQDIAGLTEALRGAAARGRF